MRFPKLFLLLPFALPACQVAQTASVSAPIVGGREVTAGEDYAKRTVAVSIRSAFGGSGICTGSIIAADLILTAAHCLVDEDGFGQTIKVIFNTTNIRTGPMGEVRDAKAVTYHDGYMERAMAGDVDQNDVGLIRFEGGLPEGAVINQILAEDRELLVGEKAILAGYGRNTVDPDAASSGSGVLRVADRVPVLRFSAEQTEVIFDQTTQPGGHGGCMGDSGGPAWVRNERGELRLFGVTSRGEQGGLVGCTQTGVYTDLRKHLAWIREKAQELRAL